MGEEEQFERKNIEALCPDLPDILQSVPFSRLFIYTFCHPTRQEEQER